VQVVSDVVIHVVSFITIDVGDVPASCRYDYITRYREHGPSLAREHSVWPDYPHGTLCPSLCKGLTVLRLLSVV